jgi:predicted RNA binding protein with dsRBD fold (UPF0201 family)
MTDGFVYQIDVRITTPVHDTEVTDRVADAIHNVFPNAEMEERHGELVAETHSLDRFAELLRRQEILDTARKQFFNERQGNAFSFALKKQAAFEGVVNFAVGDPDELGDVAVKVTVDEPDVETFVDHLAPPTEEGRPVEDPWDA